MKRANPPLDRRPPALLLGAITVLLVLSFSGAVVHFLTESWWFEAVGYPAVFWTRVRWQVAIWVLSLLLYVAFLYGNYRIALWLTRTIPWRLLQNSSLSSFAETLPNFGAIAITLLLSFRAAMHSTTAWETILKFLHPTAFDRLDPLFQRDVGFYVFQLPLYQGLQEGLSELVVWALAIALAVYALKGELRLERGWQSVLTGKAKAHICLLLAVLAILIAAGFLLERYDLLLSPEGAIFGAGYTDVHARLQAYWTMAFVTLAVAALFILALWRRGFALPVIGIGLYVVVLVLVSGLYPWFQQRFLVEPNELTRETPYIENNIAFTREAYALDQVQSEPFPAEEALTREVLDSNEPTIDNIRLWDYRPLLSTYGQLQEIRLYYRFQDVDIDRYTLNNDYRQVMLSAREMDYTEAPSEAQTWVNQRLKFTHGYGIVMSPVNRVTSDGLPELMIKNVPPVSTVDLTVDEPRIYYGEATNSYIFTGATTDEFDYPEGETNALYRYGGNGGVPLNSFLRRLAYAYDKGSLKFLISNYITNESRLHYHRNIVERAQQVAPFLVYDSDPYIAVIDGRLKWIIDGYTTSDRYPYSEPLRRSSNLSELIRPEAAVPDPTSDSTTVDANASDQESPAIRTIARNDTNYLRDAAKVVLDAYDGTLDFYIMDEADPLLNTYRQIFPGLFRAAEETPATVRAHFRYPHDLFKIQAQMYRTYHMSDPEVFYNREDVWRFPIQVYQTTQVRMDPYYSIMRLPQAESEEFIQILPFTPVRKDNMVAWMAGRSDGTDYGKLLLYEFPKQQLVYGPSQIEARIDQTPDISEQLTLWSQQGSEVVRGDLLVLPIEQSLLYVEPVYLQAEKGKLPELKRVIVAYGNQVIMSTTLEESLAAIFGAGETSPEENPTPESAETATAIPSLGADLPADLAGKVQAALDAYEAGRQALQQGDWKAYGAAQTELETILNELNQGL
ncbi:MAG: UPF0182 family protein [Cyanobacteria bacterium J06559_3]